MDVKEIERRIGTFPTWHYQFDLKGVKTPIRDESRVNRHLQRKAYFFEPLVQLCGGSLEGRRILDLGSNAGFWSLSAIEAGCDFVLGVEGRQMHVDQSNLVFEAKDVEPERYHFVAGNIFDIDFREYGTFDIVLCLGLFYHISKHVPLLEKIAEVNTDILVIDTVVARVPGRYMQIRYDTISSPRDAVDYELVMRPTRKAVHALARQFGYSTVTLRPSFSDYEGSAGYRYRRRRAFLCSKVTDLGRLQAEVEPLGLRSDLVAGVWAGRERLVNRLKRRGSGRRRGK